MNEGDYKPTGVFDMSRSIQPGTIGPGILGQGRGQLPDTFLLKAIADAEAARDASAISEIDDAIKGRKDDNGKPPISLIARSALEAEAAVMGFGAKKYGANNWRKGMAWSRCIDAAMRHLLAFADGEDTDPESFASHLAHARCNLAFLIEFAKTHKDKDDRHVQPK